MGLSIKKAVIPMLAAAFAAVAIPASTYGLLQQEWGNARFSSCLAHQTGGNSMLGIVTDQEGEIVIVNPVLRPYGTDFLGNRMGMVVRPDIGNDTLTFSLSKTRNGYEGHWDFTRIFGYPLPTGTLGRDAVQPDARQRTIGEFALYCANNPWVNGPWR